MSAEKARFLLSTIDNPYDPFTDYTRWYLEDLRLGHDTCGLLARLASGSDVIEDNAEVSAMRDIVQYNLSGKHIVVVREDFNPFLQLKE